MKGHYIVNVMISDGDDESHTTFGRLCVPKQVVDSNTEPALFLAGEVRTAGIAAAQLIIKQHSSRRT